MSYLFHPTILRAYDIRGEIGITLSAKDAYAIGRSFAQKLAANIARKKAKPPIIAVGRDGRTSSPELAGALMDGLCDSGADVIDIGVGATPMLYFADRIFNCDGAIQVTGSHNPKQFNGFKLVAEHASFFGDDILALAEIARDGWQTPEYRGKITAQDITARYVDRLAETAEAEGLRIVWDCGNGATGPAVDQLVQKLGGEHKTLYTEIDGTFPNHHPNPVDPETLDSLRAEVAAFSADCGIGFDGDGDRIGLIDSKGRQIPGDILTAYLAMDILAHNKGAEIIFDVKSSAMAMKLVESYSGQASLWKTGHSHMKKRLKERNAPLAGEMSGHIFIADGYYGFDDALFVACRLTAIMARTKQQTGKTIADFIDSLDNQIASPECRIDCADEIKFQVMDRLTASFQQRFSDDQLNLIDGVRLTTDAGWCLIRPSNTEGALICRAEASTHAAYDELIALLKTELAAVDIDWQGPPQ
jgi:phosphomannomutase